MPGEFKGAMVPSITFLHTSDQHIDTFETLLANRGVAVGCRHIVRADWLQEALRDGITDRLRSSVQECLTETARSSDVVLCTCSTIGPLIDDCSGTLDNVIRIDRPMAERAMIHDGPVLVAYCLESTRQPTLDLLEGTATAKGCAFAAELADCGAAWPHFEAGDRETFGRAVAGIIRKTLDTVDAPACVVLSQASMMDAEPYLDGLGIPVLSTPVPALEATLAAIGA